MRDEKTWANLRQLKKLKLAVKDRIEKYLSFFNY